jgi:hypothetical protein
LIGPGGSGRIASQITSAVGMLRCLPPFPVTVIVDRLTSNVVMVASSQQRRPAYAASTTHRYHRTLARPIAKANSASETGRGRVAGTFGRISASLGS